MINFGKNQQVVIWMREGTGPGYLHESDGIKTLPMKRYLFAGHPAVPAGL